MHLNFLDTSPLKVFAFCLRCRQSRLVCRQVGPFVDFNVISELAEVSRIRVPLVDAASPNGPLVRI